MELKTKFLNYSIYPASKSVVFLLADVDMKTAGTTLEGIHHFQENMEEYGNILRTGGML